MRTALLCLASLLSASSSFAGAPELRAEILRILAEKKVPAAAVTVTRGPSLVYSEGFGTLEATGGEPAGTRTLFRVASVSKVFTTLGVLKLVDRGLLRLDDPLVRHLPWFRLADPAGRWRSITVRQLLSHTSGISRELGCQFTTSRGEWLPLRELEPCVTGREVVFEPGTRLKYSNLGLTIAGHLIAELVGDRALSPMERYEEFMKREVLAPLGMSASSFTVDGSRFGSLATGHGGVDQRTGRRVPFPRAKTTYISAPAWGLATNATDAAGLLVFLDALANGRDNGLLGRGLSAELLANPMRDVFGNPTLAHAIGFQLLEMHGSSWVGHGGHFPGYTTRAFYEPATGLGIVVLSSSIDRAAASDLFRAVVREFHAQGQLAALPAAFGEEEAFGSQALASVRATEPGALTGTYRGWPASIEIRRSGAGLAAQIGDREWPLTPEGDSGLRFRLDTAGKPDYLAPLGEPMEFRFGEDGRPVLFHMGVYDYRKAP